VKESMKPKSVFLTVLLLALALVIILASGLASSLPDGFEWAFFVYAGLPEPGSAFDGIWSFLGQGLAVEILKGITGMLMALTLGYAVFRITWRKSGRTNGSN
jgi:hypothetical protein